MGTITVEDYLQAHDILDSLHNCLIDWYLLAQFKAPQASGPLLKAACCVFDATEALSACAVAVLPAMVPPTEEED